MPKDKKLLLSDLKVQSFVTELDKGKENKIKGGCYPTHYNSGCPTRPLTGPVVCLCVIEDSHGGTCLIPLCG